MLKYIKKFEDLKYVKLKGQTKIPFEKNWQETPYNFEEILAHHNQGNNYGILTGTNGLIIIDADKVTSIKDKNVRLHEKDQELINKIEDSLPETLTIESGSGARHYYYYCKDIKKKIVLNDTECHWGEILSKGSQAVGPGSIHPETKKEYKIIKHKDIQTISTIQLYKALEKYIPQMQTIQSEPSSKSSIDELRVSDIFSTSGLKKTSDGQLCGPHPVHGSSTGVNFWIDESKNTWFCFRCNSGGGPASAIAVKEGVVSCSGTGSLRGSLFRDIVRIAQDSYGLKKEEYQAPAESFQQIQKQVQEKEIDTSKLDLNLWTFQDFENYEIDNSFLVDKVIYPKTITMLYSPPGEFKSIMAVYMALAIAQGQPWVGFNTEQNAVLYCDKENNDRIIKERLMALYKGCEYKDKEMPLYFLRREGDLIRNKRVDSVFLDKLFYNIEKYNIKVVFFDTMHRFGDYDENSSDDINLLYTQVFQPLIEKYDCSVIFLHHTNKDGAFRGSGDFLGMVDTAYKFKRKGKIGSKSNEFNIVNEKNRSGEVETVSAELEFNMKEINDTDALDTIEIILHEEQINQKDAFYSQVRNTVRPSETKYKRDITELLKNQEIEFSESKLKRALRWLIDRDIFERDELNRYSLKENIKIEDIMEDME